MTDKVSSQCVVQVVEVAEQSIVDAVENDSMTREDAEGQMYLIQQWRQKVAE